MQKPKIFTLLSLYKLFLKIAEVYRRYFLTAYGNIQQVLFPYYSDMMHLRIPKPYPQWKDLKALPSSLRYHKYKNYVGLAINTCSVSFLNTESEILVKF